MDSGSPSGQNPQGQAQPLTDLDRLRLQKHLQALQENQSLGRGMIGGVLGAAIGATLWAVVTAVTGYKIGWMAVGIGFLTGYMVRTFGKGLDRTFGYLGAGLALAGCLAGNLLTVCIVLSRHRNIPIFDLLARLDLGLSLALLKATFRPMDLLFYGIAIWEGYKFSFVRIAALPPAGTAQ
jgi:hypothetical protein